MTNPILQFFKYSHLSPALREVSQPFGELAAKIASELPSNPELSVALRKLLEAKDAAVRAKLYKADWQPEAEEAKPSGPESVGIGATTGTSRHFQRRFS